MLMHYLHRRTRTYRFLFALVKWVHETSTPYAGLRAGRQSGFRSDDSHQPQLSTTSPVCPSMPR